MTTVRRVLATVGVAAGLYGVILFVTGSFSDLVSVALWFALCVVVHDLLVSPLLAVGGAGAARVLPRGVRPPLMFGAVATLALVAVASPVLFRSSAIPDNPSVLDRNYPVGLLVALAIVWAAVGLAVVARCLRSRPEPAAARMGP